MKRTLIVIDMQNDFIEGATKVSMTYKDEYTWEEACADPYNMLKTVFKDGKMVKEYTLKEVRDRLHGGKF